MSGVTMQDFRQGLREVMPDDTDAIVIHSGIWSFAFRLGIRTPEDVDAMIDVIAEVVGPDRTLVLPAYNFEFTRTGAFDLVRSKPEVGLLPERAWPRLGMHRTPQPMNSYFVTGPRADEVLSRPCTTAWGQDSILGWMEEVNARICILGVTWEQGCSLMHRGEEMAQVPYRYYKKFSGKLFDDGREVGPCQEVVYSRPRHVMLEDDWSAVTDRIYAAGQVVRTSNSGLPFLSARSRPILEHCLAALEADPYALLINADRIRAWVANEKEAEVAGLLPEQRWP